MSPWMRLDDGAMGNLKILRLSDSAFRLWITGLCYCQRHLTDGLIPREALGELNAKRKDVNTLTKPQIVGKAPLWETVEGFGFKVHDFLDWNDSREEVLKKREASKDRAHRSRNNRARAAQQAPHVASGVVSSVFRSSEGVQGKPDPSQPVGDQIATRAADFLEKYAELYAQHRNGAKVLKRASNVDWVKACELCATWDDERLTKLAVIFLTTDEQWISGTGREFHIFHSKAQWCEERLAAWEAQNRRAS